MTTKPLHKILSLVIHEQLCGIAWTPSNCARYLTKDVLAQYCIKRETPVTVTDWNKALALAREQRTTDHRQSDSESFRQLYLELKKGDSSP